MKGIREPGENASLLKKARRKLSSRARARWEWEGLNRADEGRAPAGETSEYVCGALPHEKER